MHIYSVATVATINLVLATAVVAADLEEVTVTATPLGNSLQPARTLDEEALLLKRAPTIGETLDSEPGISSSYFGPAASRPIIRGLGGSRVKVLTDTVSTLDVADISADHALTVEAVLAKRIEIIRGPATLFYGSQAAGGIVNVDDGRVPDVPPDDGLDGAIELRGETASGEQALVGRLDAGMGQLALHLGGFTRETDDLEIAGFATANPAERPSDEPAGRLRNSASETDKLIGGASWVFASGFIGVAVERYESRYGLPGSEEEESGDEPAVFPGPFIDLEQTRFDLRSELTFAAPLERIRLSFGANDYEHTEVEPSGEPATRFENEAWQGRLELSHAEISGITGALGVQIDERDFSAVGAEAFVAPVNTQSQGFFLTERLARDWGRIEVGLRADWLEHRPSALAEYDEAAISAAVGAVIPFGEVNELYANLARTERHPAAEELYSNGPHLATRQFEIGLLADAPEASGRVEKEKSLNLDLGLRHNAGLLQLQAAFFYNDIDDYIYQALTGDTEDELPVAVYRQADARFWGIETEIQLRLEDRLPLAPRLRIFADFVDAELKTGEQLPRIPPLRLGTGMTIGGNNWDVDLDIVYHDKQDDISSFRTDEYTMLNLGGRYRLEYRRLTIEAFARASNLLDEEARKSTSFLAAFAPLPGASLRAGLRVSF